MQIIGNVRATALPFQRPRIYNSGVYYQIQILMFPSPHEETILELCMPTVRLYAISQLRTVNNCCMLTSPMATFLWP